MKRAQWALAGLMGALALVVVVAAQAQVVTGKPTTTLKGDVVKASKQKDEVVDKIFKALGPAFRAQLQAGRTVEVPGVGSFRVVRVSEYKDLVGGRPTTVPARSYVEYAPAGDVTTAANAPGTVPAKTVQGYEFRVNPSAAPGLKNEGTRNPGIRTR
jgi:nucleoid DNA-binding protein